MPAARSTPVQKACNSFQVFIREIQPFYKKSSEAMESIERLCEGSVCPENLGAERALAGEIVFSACAGEGLAGRVAGVTLWDGWMQL